MTKSIELEEIVVIKGLSKERTKFLEKCKKIVKKSTLIAAEKNPNFFPLSSDENQYELIIKTSEDILYDAEIISGRGCYIGFVSVNPNAYVISADREGLSIGYKGFNFKINYGEIPKKDDSAR